MKKIILASSSPRRKEILGILGLEFDIDPSNYEESMGEDPNPKELAQKLSKGKADDVAKRHKNAVVIGADTLISFEEKVLGKPKDKEDATRMLHKLSGKDHSVITGFTIIDTQSGKSLSDCVETKVYFRQLTIEEIGNYIKTGEPLDKAGAYAIQGKGALLIEKIEGDYFNVMGLPLSKLAISLQQFGIKVI